MHVHVIALTCLQEYAHFYGRLWLSSTDRSVDRDPTEVDTYSALLTWLLAARGLTVPTRQQQREWTPAKVQAVWSFMLPLSWPTAVGGASGASRLSLLCWPIGV
jgi:hypothetical protein